MSSVFSHESAQRNHLRVQHLHNCNHLRVQNGNANERETSYGSTLRLTKMSPLTLVDVFSNFLTYISMLDIHITGFSIEILWKCHIVVCQTWDQPSVVITIRSWGLRKNTVTPSRACNCDKPEDCPLKGHCTGVQCVVYKATISAPNHAEKYYYGLSEPEFKSRYANHKSSLKYPSKRNMTELSKYYWELRDKGVDKKDIKVDCNIERQAHKYKCGTQGDATCVLPKSLW